MCRDCRNKADLEKHRRWTEAHPEEARERYRRYDSTHNDARRSRWQNEPGYREKSKEACKRYRLKNRETLLDMMRIRKRQQRQWLIALYGGKCECCGETRWEFLAIDHLDGGGSQERKRFGTTAYYKHLADAGRRLPGYRLLCHNCNASLGMYGYSPHTKKSSIADPSDAGMLDASAPAVMADFART